MKSLKRWPPLLFKIFFFFFETVAIQILSRLLLTKISIIKKEQSFSAANSSYISILSVNFENLTIKLHILIIFFVHVKFQENQKSIAISSNKY